jgi:hypothetical protein
LWRTMLQFTVEHSSTKIHRAEPSASNVQSSGGVPIGRVA